VYHFESLLKCTLSRNSLARFEPTLVDTLKEGHSGARKSQSDWNHALDSLANSASFHSSVPSGMCLPFAASPYTVHINTLSTRVDPGHLPSLRGEPSVTQSILHAHPRSWRLTQQLHSWHESDYVIPYFSEANSPPSSSPASRFWPILTLFIVYRVSQSYMHARLLDKPSL